jgi:hypothetical protein
VVCAVAAYDGIRMSDWHLAQHLSKLAPVLYADPPSFRRRLRQEGPDLARLAPVVPPFPARPAEAGKAFQKENGISPVDGIVGPQTKAASITLSLTRSRRRSPVRRHQLALTALRTQPRAPPSASIPPGQQSYFQCQPPGEPGKNINATDCILGLTALGLGAAAGPAGGLADLWALGGLGVGDVAAVRAC